MKTSSWLVLWQQRSQRERRLLLLAACVLVVAGLWQWLVSPALVTWRDAAQQQVDLDRKTQEMMALQAQARQLQAPARMSRTQAVEWLETSAAEILGKAPQLQLQGEQVRVSITAVPAPDLASWLSQAREKAQALPLTAQLQQVKPHSEPTGDAPPVLWSGQLTLRLP